jgi:hypothetical protein
VTICGQEPLWLQLAGRVATALLHEGARHWVEEPGKSQAFGLAPSQTPLQAELSPTQAVRVPCGAPAVTVVQVPSVPATSHAWHWPPQALLQQRPSTQKPLPQSLAAEQVWPLSLTNATVMVWACSIWLTG